MSTPTNDGGPAFPRPIGSFIEGHGGKHSPAQPGMALRDWFAGQALSNADISTRQDTDMMTAEMRTACRCYRYADAMLAERAKGGAR